MEKMSVSLIVPTKNSKELLQRHIDDLVEISNNVIETIVVDSSDNGETIDFLEKCLPEPSTIFISMPLGLYQAWNAGIKKAKSDYIYIATSGDRMDLNNFRKLYSTAIKFSGDITVSAPNFVSQNGSPVKRKWPVHEYLEYTQCKAPGVIPKSHVSCCNILQFPRTLIGSSASNIYKTSFIKKHLFPVDLGSQGDAVWAVMHCLKACWAIDPSCTSEFVIHESSKSSYKNNIRDKQLEIIFEYLKQDFEETHDKEKEKVLNYFKYTEQAFKMRDRLNLKRKEPLGNLNPKVWYLRKTYKSYVRFKQKLIREAMIEK